LRRASWRQRLEACAFKVDPLCITCIDPANDDINEASIAGQVCKVAHDEGIVDRPLQVAVGALDRTVLMGHAFVIA
jgi:hypothetical protein